MVRFCLGRAARHLSPAVIGAGVLRDGRSWMVVDNRLDMLDLFGIGVLRSACEFLLRTTYSSRGSAYAWISCTMPKVKLTKSTIDALATPGKDSVYGTVAFQDLASKSPQRDAYSTEPAAQDRDCANTL